MVLVFRTIGKPASSLGREIKLMYASRNALVRSGFVSRRGKIECIHLPLQIMNFWKDICPIVQTWKAIEKAAITCARLFRHSIHSSIYRKTGIESQSTGAKASKACIVGDNRGRARLFLALYRRWRLWFWLWLRCLLRGKHDIGSLLHRFTIVPRRNTDFCRAGGTSTFRIWPFRTIIVKFCTL